MSRPKTLALRLVSPSGEDKHRGEYRFKADDGEHSWVSSDVMFSLTVEGVPKKVKAPDGVDYNLTGVFAPYKIVREGVSSLEFYEGSVDSLDSAEIGFPPDVIDWLSLGEAPKVGPCTYLLGADRSIIKGYKLTEEGNYPIYYFHCCRHFRFINNFIL